MRIILNKIIHLYHNISDLLLMTGLIPLLITVAAPTVFAEPSGDTIIDNQGTTVQISPDQSGGNPNTVSNPNQPSFSQGELEQMLAPIALYPDALLSQILMASTYPLEVVEAARWSQAHSSLTGDDAVSAAKQNDWDPSVLSLTAFPQVLGMMDQKLEWTERLGDAFLGQQPLVMETIQKLRQQAQAAGNLQSTDQLVVRPQGEIIAIEPVSPQVVYVPYYDPNIIYGSWGWSNYPPVYWAPWPGYVVRPHFVSGFYFSNGISVRANFFFGRTDWRHHQVNVVNVNNYYYHTTRYQTTIVQRNAPNSNNRVITGTTATANVRSANNPANNSSAWQHDTRHRLGVPYQHGVFQGASPQSNPGNMRNMDVNPAVGANAGREGRNNNESSNPSSSTFRNQQNANQRAITNNAPQNNSQLNVAPAQTTMQNPSVQNPPAQNQPAQSTNAQTRAHSGQATSPNTERMRPHEPRTPSTRPSSQPNPQEVRIEAPHRESTQSIRGPAPAQSNNAGGGHHSHHEGGHQ